MATLPITLLTGFLGSGKTTILNHLLRQPALSRSLVIVNEFGEVGIDHDLIETGSEDFVVLQGGCVCCTVRSDLIDSLRSLFQRRVRGQIAEFDRVIIETTGLADPAPIVNGLIADPFVQARYRLDGVIATVDALRGWDTLDRAPEALKQAALADRLLLTKTDLADPQTVEQLTGRLRRLNPLASVLIVKNAVADAAQLLDIGLYDPKTKSLDAQAWLNDIAFDDHHADHEHIDVNRHDDHIKSFSIALDEPVLPEAFSRWLEALSQVAGPDLLRVKGLVNIAGQNAPTVIHAVQHKIHPPLQLTAWPSTDRRTRIVFITRGLDEAELRGMLQTQLY